MVYSRPMRDLMPPRTFSVTFAALLAIITGIYWVAVSVGVLVWGGGTGTGFPGLRLKASVALVVLGCAGTGALISGRGILFRRNWARILAIAAAGPLIFSGLWDLYVILRLPNLQIRGKDIVSFVLPFF